MWTDWAVFILLQEAIGPFATMQLRRKLKLRAGSARVVSSVSTPPDEWYLLRRVRATGFGPPYLLGVGQEYTGAHNLLFA